MAHSEEGMLVLCVDIDNDVGEKLGIKTPIVGEKQVLDVALRYALTDPEDSDANAMFAAINEYRRLKNEEGIERVEVAVIAGSPKGGGIAGVKIIKELNEVIAQGGYRYAVLVSDGPTDEEILPTIQKYITVVGVRRVIVQQSRSMEETFVLLARYLRKLVEEEQYRKYTLGIPGTFILLYAILSVLIPGYIWHVTTLIIGIVLLIKGFSLDQTIVDLYHSFPITLLAGSIASFLFFIAFIGGIQYVANLSGITATEALGYFLTSLVGGQIYVVDLIVMALTLPLVGRIIDQAQRGPKPSDVGALVFIITLRQVLIELSKLLIGGGNALTLILWILASIVITTISIALVQLAIREKEAKT